MGSAGSPGGADPASPPGAGRWGIVVGAGPGMGRSLALQMARTGLSVVLVAREGVALAQLRDEVARLTGAHVIAVPVDARYPNNIANVVAGIADTGSITCLAYNAAALGGPLLQTSADALSTSLAVNVLSAIAAVRAATESLVATAGSVLITGGGLALHPTAAAAVLSLGKAALRAAALLLAQELGPRGVTVRTLTVAGTIGSTPAFDPDRLAQIFWSLRDSAEVELVYRGDDDH